MMLRAFSAPAVAVALLATPALMAAAGPGSHVPPPEVTVIATEYHFDAPATLPAGPTLFHLENRGTQVHHVTIIRLDGGKTMRDFAAAMSKPGPLPTWAVLMGGPNAVGPGGSSEAVVDLTPGNYMLACFVPDSNGVPHAAKGMVHAFTVTPATAGAAAAMPAADVTVTLVSYGFTYSTPLSAGSHRLLVRNAGDQWHELVLFRLADGKTARDLLAWAEGGMKTAPPGSFDGGASPLAPGQSNVVPVDLQPGHYVVLCFLEDKTDGKPHFMHGMIQELTLD